MQVTNVLCSKAGNIVKVAAGVCLLAQGMALATLGGLVMMMAGVFLAVTGLADVCFLGGPAHVWTAAHRGASPAHRDHS